MTSLLLTLCLILVSSILLSIPKSAAFSHNYPSWIETRRFEGSSRLFSSNVPRQPRRNLKKRRRRERKGRSIEAESFPWETAESRPLVKSVSREYGEDYWIDEKDLEAERLRMEGIKNRKAMEGEVPKEKLWSEVKAPYKQNWIGNISIVIAILSMIVIKFPQLLEQPTIPIPDL